MGLVRTAVRIAAPMPQIDSFERYLFIGPHPDDLEIGAGATAARLAAMGKKICFLICTDGRYGDGFLPEGISCQEIIRIRKEESLQSAAYLGITDVRFLGLSDGGFYEKKELERGIAQTVGDFQPDLILAPDPCVTSECHADHLNAGEAARRIACFAPYAGIMQRYGAGASDVKAIAYYMTAKPNRFVATGGYLKRQLRSVKKFHTSQFPPGSGAFDAIELYLKLRAFENGLRSHHRCAEGFRMLGQTQMHCLPEAGN